MRCRTMVMPQGAAHYRTGSIPLTILALLFLVLSAAGLLAGAVRLRRMRLEEARRARAEHFQRELDALAAKRRSEAHLKRLQRDAEEKHRAAVARSLDDWQPRRSPSWD